MSEEDLKSFENEIDMHVKRFLALISSTYREGFEYDRDRKQTYDSGFPVFGLADASFYQSKFQVEYLEWKVRDMLVNTLLNYLFKAHNYDTRWRLGDSCITTGGFSNEENEQKFPVVFFIVKDEKNIAYRYTQFGSDYSILYNLPQDMNLMYYQTGVKRIDQWVSIDWSGLTRQQATEKQCSEKFLKNLAPFQIVITIEELFGEYFSDVEYDLFISRIKEAVNRANSIIGFQTIPRLVSNNLSVFKAEVLTELLNTDFSLLKYRAVNENGDPSSDCSDGTLEANDPARIRNNFDTQSRYLALIGTSKFAKSFLTSEYLFKIFKSGISFDYTSVVSGYIKSVEQLCATIVYDIYVPKSDQNLFIMAKYLNKTDIDLLNKTHSLKKIGKYFYVSMQEENQAYFDHNLTMGQLFYFFDVNKEFVFNIDPIESEPKIFACMYNFFSFDRNGYFHKDNVDEFIIAERIRNNTLLLLYWLLGATTLSGDAAKDYEGLGIVDDRFDRLYKKVVYRRQFKYTIKLGDGIERKVIHLREGGKHSFDNNGYLQDAELVFCAVDQYPENYTTYCEYTRKPIPQSDRIVLDQDHLPDEIDMIESDGTKIKIDF